MNSTTRTILFVLPLLAAVVAFWLLVLSPKREEASELEREASDLQAQLEEQEQLAVAAEAARQDFPRAYRRLVVLGKATPTDDDTSSLLVQLQGVADEADVEFLALQTQEGDAAAAVPPAAEPQSAGQAAESSEQRVADAEAGGATAPVPAATEATAAVLPIGASIGPAGLPVMKYTLSFTGDFFHLADFVEALDDLVTTRQDGHVGVKGRLITIDGFTLLIEGEPSEHPTLAAEFEVTTFLTPPEEGPTGGASPTGPAPVTEPQPVEAPASPADTATASTSTP